MKLVDTHCHIPHRKYDRTIPEIIEGVDKIIAVGTSIKENNRTIEIANKYENIFASVGIYPHDDMEKEIGELYSQLKTDVAFTKVVAIGEGGIDITKWKGGRSIEDQVELFKMQIGLSTELDLPIIVHNRNGDDVVYETLKKYIDNGIKIRGVMHSFSQTKEFAKKMLDFGFHISFSGMITYPPNVELREVARMIPADRLLAETDAPYLPPQGHRGEINYPKYVRIVAEKLAEVRNTPIEDISQTLYRNSNYLFGI